MVTDADVVDDDNLVIDCPADYSMDSPYDTFQGPPREGSNSSGIASDIEKC